MLSLIVPVLLSVAPFAGERSGVRVVALAQVEIVAPVTNAPAPSHAAVEQMVTQTRDGRYFVEYQ